MDNTNQTPIQSQTSTGQPVVSIQPQPQGQVLQGQPVIPTSVGTVSKEQMVSAAVDTSTKTPEVIKPSGAELEPTISPELSRLGIETPKVPTIPDDAQKAGITLAKESVPVLQQTQVITQLMQQLTTQGANKQNTSYSSYWLWALLKKIIKQLKV